MIFAGRIITANPLVVGKGMVQWVITKAHIEEAWNRVANTVSNSSYQDTKQR